MNSCLFLCVRKQLKLTLFRKGDGIVVSEKGPVFDLLNFFLLAKAILELRTIFGYTNTIALGDTYHYNMQVILTLHHAEGDKSQIRTIHELCPYNTIMSQRYPNVPTPKNFQGKSAD